MTPWTTRRPSRFARPPRHSSTAWLLCPSLVPGALPPGHPQLRHGRHCPVCPCRHRVLPLLLQGHLAHWRRQGHGPQHFLLGLGRCLWVHPPGNRPLPCHRLLLHRHPRWNGARRLRLERALWQEGRSLVNKQTLTKGGPASITRRALLPYRYTMLSAHRRPYTWSCCQPERSFPGWDCFGSGLGKTLTCAMPFHKPSSTP